MLGFTHRAFLPAPFEWSIGYFLIPGSNAQACPILHTWLFYLLILNRARHFSYSGFNVHGFLVCNSWHFAQVKLSWHFCSGRVILAFCSSHSFINPGVLHRSEFCSSGVFCLGHIFAIPGIFIQVIHALE